MRKILDQNTPPIMSIKARLKAKLQAANEARTEKTSVIAESTEMSSSEIRLKLRSVLRTVKETNKPTDIRMDGKVIAQLTLDRPSYKVPALPIKIVDAQKSWSELLTYVWVSGARYVFTVRFEEDEPAEKIYLFRPLSAEKNIFQEPWQEHRAKFTPQASSPISISEMQESIDILRKDIEKQIYNFQDVSQKTLLQISNRMAIVFAKENRPNGDIFATPEMGISQLRSTRDFDSGNFIE